MWWEGILAAGVLLACGGLTRASELAPFHECPAVGSDAGCAILYVFNPDGTVTGLGDSSAGPYDGEDDTLVGVLNLSGVTQPSLTLSGAGMHGTPIFAFDGDGICTLAPFAGSFYCAFPGSKSDPGDYGGPDASFVDLSSDRKTGTIRFEGGLANGASTYFSLEDVLDPAAPPGAIGDPIGTAGAPEPGGFALIVAGAGLLRLVRRR